MATAKLLKTFCLKTENITEDFKRLFTSIFLMNSPFIMWTWQMSCYMSTVWIYMTCLCRAFCFPFQSVGWLRVVCFIFFVFFCLFFVRKIENYKEKSHLRDISVMSECNSCGLSEDVVTEERGNEHWPFCCLQGWQRCYPLKPQPNSIPPPQPLMCLFHLFPALQKRTVDRERESKSEGSWFHPRSKPVGVFVFWLFFF